MIKLYFVCMGNYYRSRLAEELARHYGAQHGVEVSADSGGLALSAGNKGPIAKLTLLYLQQKNFQPLGDQRYPKECSLADMQAADLVVCTDRSEQLRLFEDKFPEYTGDLIAWQAPDWHADPFLSTPQLIDRNVEQLISSYKDK